jgi:hypothetical protein
MRFYSCKYEIVCRCYYQFSEGCWRPMCSWKYQDADIQASKIVLLDDWIISICLMYAKRYYDFNMVFESVFRSVIDMSLVERSQFIHDNCDTTFRYHSIIYVGIYITNFCFRTLVSVFCIVDSCTLSFCFKMTYLLKHSPSPLLVVKTPLPF